MKTDIINSAVPRLKTINECLRVLPETCPAHSKGEPDVSAMNNHINIRFVTILVRSTMFLWMLEVCGDLTGGIGIRFWF